MRNPIKALQEAQKKHGYLSKETLRSISNNLKLPLSQVYGIATFYHQFRLEPVGEFIIYICKGTACHIKAKETISQYLRQYLGLKPNETTTDDGLFTLEYARCFGCCSLAPAVMIVDRSGFRNQIFGNLTPVRLRKIIEEHKKAHLLMVRGIL